MGENSMEQEIRCKYIYIYYTGSKTSMVPKQQHVTETKHEENKREGEIANHDKPTNFLVFLP